jgi:hypothetical protein
MAAFTNYLEDAIIQHLFRTGSFAKPTVLSIALFTAVTAGEAGTVTEVATGSYGRVDCNPLDANWAASVGGNGTTSNIVAVTFPEATADWGTVTHFGLYDAHTAGNLLVFAALTIARTITTGSTPSFAAGTLTIQVDN